MYADSNKFEFKNMLNWRTLILGPAYFKHVRLIEQSKQWNAAQIGHFQRQQISFLEGLWDQTKTYDKESYRYNSDKFEKKQLRFLTKKITTGGTSGSPFAFYIDRIYARQKERAYIFDIWSGIGYKPFDLRVIFRGNLRRKLISYDSFENAYILSPDLITHKSLPDLKRFLSSIPPFFLHVYPSSMLSFIDLLGIDFVSHLPIKGILAGSEVFPAAQMDWLHTTLSVPIAHWYGHTEYAVLANYCHECSGFHFYPTYGLVEFDEAEGGKYEIIATSFRKLGTRFVRYRTEDLALVDKTYCAASAFTRVSAIIGRRQEYFIDRNGFRRTFNPFLFAIHGEFWDWINNIQFVQKDPGRLICRVNLRDGHRTKKLVEAVLRKRFSVVDLEFEHEAIIAKTIRGKHRYFINEMKQADQPGILDGPSFMSEF